MLSIVRCATCGKEFRPGDSAVCGGTINGRQICEQTRLQREIDERLKPAVEAEKQKGTQP